MSLDILTRPISFRRTSRRLHADGLLCSLKPSGDAGDDRTLDSVSSITGIGPQQWYLWRKRPSPRVAQPNRASVLFATMPVGPLWAIFPNKNHVKLDAVSIAEFCTQKDIGRFDAIILGTPEQSVITQWTGKDFMPWMQTLLRCADSILWITESVRSPFANVTGTLLRTTQSEKPSLKVKWLVLGDAVEQPSDIVLQAYNGILGGDNEILVQSHHTGPRILRYYPDDELSSTTGLIPH